MDLLTQRVALETAIHSSDLRQNGALYNDCGDETLCQYCLQDSKGIMFLATSSPARCTGTFASNFAVLHAQTYEIDLTK
jgi:hypothetical protein